MEVVTIVAETPLQIFCAYFLLERHCFSVDMF